jgi:hypothetical protein
MYCSTHHEYDCWECEYDKALGELQQGETDVRMDG